MCWIGEKKDRKIATKDLTVYKILLLNKSSNTLVAPYFRDFYYTIGANYYYDSIINPVPVFPCDDTIKIEAGLHCYSEKCKVKSIGPAGVAIYSPKDFLTGVYHRQFETYAVIKCTIKVGNLYYENNLGEIVTDSLVLDSMVSDIKKEVSEFKEYEKSL